MTATSSHNRLLAVWRLTRPFTLVPPMLGMLSGAVAAIGATQSSLHPQMISGVIFGSLMAACLNAASNIVNQIFDLEIDRINKPARPIPSGEVSLRAAAWWATIFYLSALILAWFVDQGRRECFFLVVLTVVLTYMYSAPPWRFRRYGWRANLTVALPRGLLLKVAGWSTVAGVFADPEPWLLGSVFFVFLIGATTTKDFADVAGDRAQGVRTLPVRLGPERAVWRTAPFLLAPGLLFLGFAWSPLPILRAAPWALGSLGALVLVYGAWIARLLIADPAALSRSENHPAWKHMYGLMMFTQVGSCLVYYA